MVLEDNDVDHFALWKRTYQPGIFWSGVNNTSAGVDSKQRQPCLATLPGGPLGGGCGEGQRAAGAGPGDGDGARIELNPALGLAVVRLRRGADAHEHVRRRPHVEAAGPERWERVRKQVGADGVPAVVRHVHGDPRAPCASGARSAIEQTLAPSHAPIAGGGVPAPAGVAAERAANARAW